MNRCHSTPSQSSLTGKKTHSIGLSSDAKILMYEQRQIENKRRQADKERNRSKLKNLLNVSKENVLNSVISPKHNVVSRNR